MIDLIRREDAIKAYNEAMDELVKWQMTEWQLGDFTECEFNTTDCKHIVRKIEAIPSVNGSQEWIPCSERLPKKYEQVLCCNKDGRVFSTALTYVHPEYKYWYFGKHRSVIAWMPLPKPWKGADDE